MATRAEHPEPRPQAAGPCLPPAVQEGPAIIQELPPAASPVLAQVLPTPPSRPMDLRWSLEDLASPTEDPEDPDRCIPQALPQVGEDDLHTRDQATDLLADLLDQGDPLAPGLRQTGLLTAQEATPPPGGRAQA